MTQSITINNQDYAIADLPEAARTQIANLQITDAEIARLQQQLAIAQTARNAYAAALIAAVEPAPAEPKPKPATKKAPAKKG